MDAIDKKTGEVYELKPLNNFKDLEELIQNLLIDKIKFYEALALLVSFRIQLSKYKLAFQDGMFNAYGEKLDFSDESKYWKSTFDSKKIKDQLMVQNKEYLRQSREIDRIQELFRAIEATTDLTKSMQWSSWGRKAPNES